MNRSMTLLALTTLPLLLGCDVRRSQAKGQPATTSSAAPLSVATTPVRTQALPRSLTLTGTLIASSSSSVAADAMGRVTAVYVERGSRVSAGQPLARLDRRQAMLSEAAARAQAGQAHSQSALATLECARAERLFRDDVINRAEYDRTQTQCQSASFAATTARVQQRMAGKNLGDTLIRAPFAGVIADRFISPGEYVRADSRVVNLVQLDPLRLELSVPEHVLSAFGVGAEVRFQVAAWPGQTFVGQVRFVGAAVRRASRDLLVEAVVPNSDERLRPGMFAIAEVKLGETVLPVIPLSAIKSDERSGTDRVFVVVDGQVQERLVHKGPIAGPVIAIRSGVKPGEKVVLSPVPALRDGLRVQ